MVTRTLTLAAGGVTVDLQAPESLLVPGMSGGLPPVDPAWLIGAGDGAIYRGARVLPREITIPVVLRGDAIAATLDSLTTVLAPQNAPARLTMSAALGSWWVDVVRTGGGDWQWGQDSDGSEWLQTSLTLSAGQPFWTRGAVETVASTGTGSVSIANPGTAPAWPTWTLAGPATALTLTSAAGEVLQWVGTLADGSNLVIDTEDATIAVSTTSRYSELAAAPRFWPLPAGSSTITVAITGGDGGTALSLSYYPRRWLVF